jgi:hypothetical protein
MELKRKGILFLLTVLVLSFSHAQVDHWESVILPGDAFRYNLPNSNIDNWYETGFGDESWTLGNSGLGYGDDDDATIVDNTLTIYMRKSFQIVSLADIEAVFLDMDFDDGFIAYINGTEIARYLVSGENPSFDQPADGLHEADLYRGLDPERFTIDRSVLMEGENVLAIAIHNERLTSSDMTGNPTLSFGINSSTENYRPTPDWFDEPVITDFRSSNLPIVIIETTNRADILDDPRADATMFILDREDGQRNLMEDQNNADFQDFKGQIKIEIRGSSSQSLPKKQYGFTTYNNGGIKDNVSLLGMPAENDWILNGLAFDPSLMRDYLTYNLYRQMGNYTTRTEYCEVVLNGEYQGLYILLEKLKADNNRIDINKIEQDDNDFPDITGGYVTKSDRANGSDSEAWVMPNYGGWNTVFVNVTPSSEEATREQTSYIQDVFESLANTSASNNSSIYTGFPSIIDMPSFIDFMLINELSSNVDAYQLSTYFHKDRNGKLRAGPVWDSNLTYGNDLFEWGYDRSKTDVWQFFYELMGAMFWKDLFDNDIYRCYMSKRWNSLTQNGQALSQSNISLLIDETVSHVFEAKEREEARWGTVGNHDENIAALKNFVQIRSSWMTQELGSFSQCANVATPELKITAINYHPASVENYDDSDLEFIRLTNTGDSMIDLSGIYFGGTGLVYQFPNNATLESGEHVYLANESQVFTVFNGFVPFDEFSRSLENSGQEIMVLDAFGNIIDQVVYDDSAPWPIEADGEGSFLELSDFSLDNDNPENWKASTFNDVALTHNNQLEPYIRLYPNPSSNKINIDSKNLVNRISLYDSQGKPVKTISDVGYQFEIDLTELPAGIYYLNILMSHGIITRRIIHD